MKKTTPRNIPAKPRERLEDEPRARFHDLDHLAGTWTAGETKHFNELLAMQRRIDPELWKADDSSFETSDPSPEGA